jgi:riboflavin synthase
MFTGIIEELGTVADIEPSANGMRITIRAGAVTEDARAGDSIAVNGVCLTITGQASGEFSADVSPETLERSTLGTLMSGSKVNLERPVTLSTRLGGHIVQGHVDTRGTFVSAEESGDFRTVVIRFPPEISRYLVYKGSVAVEGISLTIAKLSDDTFEVAVIPKTWELTNLSDLSPGDPVNIEVDLIAKYVERMIADGRSHGSMNSLK